MNYPKCDLFPKYPNALIFRVLTMNYHGQWMLPASIMTFESAKKYCGNNQNAAIFPHGFTPSNVKTFDENITTHYFS